MLRHCIVTYNCQLVVMMELPHRFSIKHSRCTTCVTMITEEVAYASEAPDGATEGIATTTCTMPLQSRPIRRSRPCSDLIEDIQMPEEAEEINKTEVPSRSPVNTKRVSQLIELGDDNLAELRRVAGTVNVPSSPNRVPRRSSVLEDKNEVSYHPSTLQLYAPPRQRQEWGQQQILPRVNWGDLFFDLFYVAAAYNVSRKVFRI